MAAQGTTSGQLGLSCWEILFRDAVFFVLRPKNAIHGIWCSTARLVIMANLHLSQQSNSKQIQATEQQPESSHHQRPMRGHDRNMAQEFFDSQPENDSSPSEDAHHAKAAKEMQRP